MLSTLKIRDTEFKVGIADTPDKYYKGLSNLPSLGKRKGLLFIFPEKQMLRMVMRDMNFPLDFIFIKNSKIVQLASLDNKETEAVESDEAVSLILEVSKGVIEELGLQVGDVVTFSKDIIIQYKGIQKFKEGGVFEMVGDKVYKVKEDDIKIDHSKVQVLDKDGKVAANIDSGARIFSRQHTKKIIELVKQNKSQELALAIVEIYGIQDTQDQEFVEK